MKSHKVIYVNPVPRIPTQGRDKQTYTIIDPKTGELIVTQSMNKTKEFGAATIISFQLNFTTGRLETGLDVSISNPFYQMDVEDVMQKYSLSHEWREIVSKLVTKSEIKKQTLFEIYDNVSPDKYTSEISGGVTIFNLNKFKKIPENPNFLQTFNITLYDGPNRFTDETPRGRLGIQLIENNTSIAKSKQAANSSLHLFYISEQHEAEAEIAQKQDLVNKAIFAMVKLQEEGSDYRNFQIASLLTTHSGQPLIKGKESPETVRRLVSSYIHDKGHQNENIVKFMKLINMLNEKQSRERLDIMYMIQQGLNTNVLGLKDGFYIWHSKYGENNMYKHNNYDKFISLLQSEMKTWNPEDTSITNWFGELHKELKQNDIWIE